MTKQYKTILIKVTDEEAFAPVWNSLCESMQNNIPMKTAGYKVIGLSHEDEFKRIEAYEAEELKGISDQT